MVKWDFGDGTSATGESPEHAYAKWSGSEKERQYCGDLAVYGWAQYGDGEKDDYLKKQECVARDGRFCKLGNGMVLDTGTGDNAGAGGRSRDIIGVVEAVLRELQGRGIHGLADADAG